MVTHNHSSSQGNVLFLILIAVALFAALSYAVTQTTRSGGSNADREKGTIDATWLQNYGSATANGILRMRLSKNVSTDDICFFAPENPEYSNATYQSRNVFHTEGGGVVYETPPSSIVGSLPSSVAIVKLDMPNIGTTEGTADSAEVVLSIGGISQAACKAVNDRLGIPTYQITTLTQYAEPITDGYPAGCISGIAFDSSLAPASFPELSGLSEGCVADSSAPNDMFYYYRILVEH